MGVYWIDLAQDTGKWPAVVNVNYTYGFDKTQGIYWLYEELLNFQKGLCCLEVVEYNAAVWIYVSLRVLLHAASDKWSAAIQTGVLDVDIIKWTLGNLRSRLPRLSLVIVLENFIIEWLILLLHIWGARFISRCKIQLCWLIFFVVFFSLSRKIATLFLKLGYSCFLIHALKFTIN